MYNFFDRYNLAFAYPYALLLLVLVPIIAIMMFQVHKKRRTSLTVSTTKGIQRIPLSWRVKFRPVVPILQLLSVVLLILGFARLQETNIKENIESEGVDIVLSLDISGSMLAEDLKPNRLEAAKNTGATFIKERPTDRFGLVIFSGESFTQCPITVDHQVVMTQLDKITNGLLEDGTAIGMGLATGVDRLKDTKGKSRVLILLTDGINNSGLIDPLTALELAKAYNVKVYTIGVGTIGQALFPTQTQFGVKKRMEDVKIDEDLLKKISNETGGLYFRATDNNSLSNIFKEIDKMEKTKVDVSAYKQHKERFHLFVLLGISTLVLSIILQYTVFKKLP